MAIIPVNTVNHTDTLYGATTRFGIVDKIIPIPANDEGWVTSFNALSMVFTLSKLKEYFSID